MSAGQDFDRRVTAWLESGPSRSPDRPIESALAHARAHPRRRDPLATLRSDPMAARRSAALRPLVRMASLALLLVAAIAVASVGGLFETRPVVVPPLITSPSPSAAQSVEPSPSPAVIRVSLLGFDGRDLSAIDVVDGSGTLFDAKSGAPGDGGSVGTPDRADVANDPANPRTVVLTWTGILDDTYPRLTIAPDGRSMTIERVPGVGDLLPVDRVLILNFAVAVPAAEVSATIVDVAP